MATTRSHSNSPNKYSFTKLEAFHQCPYAFYLTYIKHQNGVGNAFASYGTLVHSIMERYAKGELELWELADTFEWEYDEAVTEEFPAFPQGLQEKYFDDAVNYLSNFEGYDDYKILDVEEKFELPIDDWTFNGIIDLVYEYDGRLYIQDYKSRGKFKSKRETAEKARQMYLYALYVKEKYGKYPDVLKFEMFRAGTETEIPFNVDDLNEAVTWARNTVQEIREAWDYIPQVSDYFCHNLCNHREVCEYNKDYETE